MYIYVNVYTIIGKVGMYLIFIDNLALHVCTTYYSHIYILQLDANCIKIVIFRVNQLFPSLGPIKNKFHQPVDART